MSSTSRARAISIALVASVLSGFFAQTGHAAGRLRVVATLTTFADLVKSVGGEYVDVVSIASPKFNPHFIEPKPSDVLKVKRADLFVHAGLDLEPWRGPLLDAAGNRRVMSGQPGELALAEGIELLEVPNRAMSRAEGDIHIYGNPHYWVDPRNGVIMVRRIAEKLAALDPDHAVAYRARADAFAADLERRIVDWQARLAPVRGREVVGYHNEWPYFMQFAGVTLTQFLEPNPGIPPTPKRVQFIEAYVRERAISAIVRSAHDPAGATETVAKRSGASVAVLYQSVGESVGISDYAGLIERNVAAMLAACAGASSPQEGRP